MENTFGHIGASCQQLNFIGVQKDKANVINVNILGNLSEGYTGLLCTIASFLWIWNYVKLKFVTFWVDKRNNGTTTQTRNLGLSLPTHHVPISKPIFSAILQICFKSATLSSLPLSQSNSMITLVYTTEIALVYTPILFPSNPCTKWSFQNANLMSHLLSSSIPFKYLMEYS